MRQACTCEGIRSRRLARALAPPGFLIGRSVHDPAEAAAVEAGGGCDYLLFGTVFPSTSKRPANPISGPGVLREVCATVGIPVLAVGGISVENVSQVGASGAAGIAAISLFPCCGAGLTPDREVV